MIAIAHIINALCVGGAEAMLLKLLAHTNRDLFAPRVYTLLSPAGRIAEDIRGLGIPVRELGIGQGLPNPLHLVRLAGWLRQNPPDLVQTWMYHSDLIGGLAARLAGRSMPVLWNLRNSTLDPSTSRRRTFGVVKVCAHISRWLPDAIITCSHTAGRVHAALGYPAGKIHVIPNGFDLARFRPNPAARAALRRQLGIPDGAPIVGLVGRFDPQKDHRTFVRAAGRLHAMRRDVHFVLCGLGVVSANAELMEAVDRAGIASVCRLLGERTDMPAVTAALDLATSSSAYGEAFPNTIGEAMACAVPCVATDVGDAAMIVGQTGRVVPPRDPEALCAAWQDLLGLSEHHRLQLGEQARRRVSDEFSIQVVVRSYEDAYRGLLALRMHPAPALDMP